MDEVNARREARRRKILENSENRLHKIGVKYNLDETKAGNKYFMENDSFKTSLEECTIKNGTCNFGNNINLQHYTEFNENEYERFHTRFNENKYDNQDETFLDNTNDELTYSSEKVLYKKSTLHRCLSHCIHAIVLAAVVSILLVLKLDDWFGKTIFVPYLLLIMRRWYDIEQLQKANGSNVINALIIMVFPKIKPNLICKLKHLFILYHIITYDFCWYIISFVSWHYVFTTCYYYYHILTYT